MIIDAMNVIGSVPDGWWRDRPAAQRRLLDRVAGLVASRPGRGTVMIVFEGANQSDLAEGSVDGVEVRWARRRGPDAADDRIVEEAGQAVRAGSVTVVTSDRGLRERLTLLGVACAGPSGLEQAIAAG